MPRTRDGGGEAAGWGCERAAGGGDDGVVLHPDGSGGCTNLRVRQNDGGSYTHALCRCRFLVWYPTIVTPDVVSGGTWAKGTPDCCAIFKISCESIIISKQNTKTKQSMMEISSHNQ